MDAPARLQVNLNIGFGFCADGKPEMIEGAERLRYRALPMALWRQEWNRTLAAIEEAAERFQPGDEIPFRELTWEPEPIPALSPKGFEFFEALPLYGELTARYPSLKWKQYEPGGQPVYEAEANQYEPFVQDIVISHPIEHWANWFLTPLADMLPTSAEGRPAAVFTQEPDPGSKMPFVRAASIEKVEAPWGLWKVAVYACAEDQVEEARQTDMGPNLQLLETSMAVLPKDGYEFEWKRHWVWRIELPVVLVPRMLYWVQARGYAHKGLWAARGIHPCGRWNHSHATLQRDVEQAGYRMTCHVWKTLDELTAEERSTIESDLRKILEQNPL